MYRFFVDNAAIREENIVIRGKDVNHIVNVLRMKTGENILISNGHDKDYECVIESISAHEVIARIIDVHGAMTELPSKIYLFQGIPKSDKMELIIQKAVELGVYEVIPVSTKRSIVKLDEKKAEAKVKRWNLISESAAKQSKRIIIPSVNRVMNFEEALNYAKSIDMVIIPYEEAQNMAYTKSILSAVKGGTSIGIFIGPEGGFAPEEVEAAKNMGAFEITLGKRILRTETAGMTVLSILMFLLEE
ncbi:MAG: 16S rRNA (uracil(1498)-N(3))-methyltransferase [Eubacterium sp.]